MRKLTLAAAAILAGAVGASGASAQTFDVGLKGFCNTFSLTISGFAIYGTRQGCDYTVIDGGAVAKIGKPYYETNDTNDSAEIFSWYFTPPKATGKGAWYLYEETGTGVTFVNSGKYAPLAGGKAPSSGLDVTKSPKNPAGGRLPESN